MTPEYESQQQTYLLIGWPCDPAARTHWSFHADLKSAALNFLHITNESQGETDCGRVGGVLYQSVVLYLLSLENPRHPIIQIAGSWQRSPD